MRFLATFQIADFLDTLVSLASAFVLGTLIGAERQYRQRTAGLRTNVLVAVGAAAFVDLAMRIAADPVSPDVAPTMVSGRSSAVRKRSNSRPSSCSATSLNASVGP